MEWRIWLAFGFGLLLGACGMATLIGYLALRVDKLRRKALLTIPRIIIGYFEMNKTEGSGLRTEHKEGL